MKIPTHPELVEEIDSFLARHSMAPSRFGRDAIGEPQLVGQIREGRQPNLATLLKLQAFMAEKNAELVMPAHPTGAPHVLHRLNAAER